jgi:hypothetical protein
VKRIYDACDRRPVISEEQVSGRWQYCFVLPASYTVETVPVPKDSRVRLSVMPASRSAALRYAGTWQEKRMRAKTAELQDWLADSACEAMSDTRSAGYDPPWTLPPFRRNEVIVDVEQR